jgi:hypothetical protein
LKILLFTSCSIVLALSISACQPPDDQNSDAAQQEQNEIIVEPVTDGDVLADGFYHPDPAEDDGSAREDSTDKNSLSDDDASEAIVLDSKFSSVDTDQDLSTAKPNMLPFCLGQITSSVTQNNISPAEACKRIANRLASVSEDSCNAAALQPSECESINGFPILVREFAPLNERKPQGRILVIGGTHGDELTSVSVTFRWIEKLNKHHSGLFHWHMVPMMNPDGVLKRGATRTNQNGVDHNRNMPSEDWHENALKYWEQKTGENPRRFPGENPTSEPETQWLVDEINDFKPDAIISVHAPYGVVDFDSLLLNTAPRSLGKLHLNLLGTYPGSLGNYAGINRNIPVITLELPHAWEMPSEAESTKIWEDIVSWLRKNIHTDTAATN